jgi:NAD(P)-dependent dehydrogenase (short-subunit alcohol dehydrogenase family)
VCDPLLWLEDLRAAITCGRTGYHLRVVVHNAGLYKNITSGDTAEPAVTSVEEDLPGLHTYDYYQAVYPKCFIRLCELAAPRMQASGGGAICAISSPVRRKAGSPCS